ncbi:Kunitz-type serine protease inhibitor kalicludine-1 [Orchesella cincta]|uniref:Kunitz-type serine protease inhibitor kalicludine-1 n=1 Tax=Orchesella cincta TaxID=48709 RepID=A0A1D2MN35_ORCCI|nr:Kunitz-type serine protease inhibitor kalicludine-1 [Orchesella cincta]
MVKFTVLAIAAMLILFCANSASAAALEDSCQQPMERGTCRAMHARFYYNSETKKCEKFNYGGCKKNQNNFKTMEECEKACAS